MSKVIDVLYQSNDYYAPITGVSMTSLMENNRDFGEINFFLLNDQISNVNIEKIKYCCEQYGRNLVIVETDAILTRLRDDLGVTPYKGTYTTYFKLFSFKDLPITTDRILQLDGDTIINGSLSPLCEIDLSGYIMAATYDCILNEYKSLIDIPLTDKYYNCGVLLINQPEWIRANCEERIAHHLKHTRTRYFTVDQDVLNVLFRDKTKYLDITYNLNSGFYVYGVNESFNIYGLSPEYYTTNEEVATACENPVINHCMGAMTGRPWEEDSIHPQNDLFDRYLKISPWNGTDKLKVKRAPLFRLQRALYKTLPHGIYSTLHRLMLTRFLKDMNKSVQKR